MAVDRTKEAISQSTAGGRMSAEEVAGMLYQLGADHPLIDTTAQDALEVKMVEEKRSEDRAIRTGERAEGYKISGETRAEAREAGKPPQYGSSYDAARVSELYGQITTLEQERTKAINYANIYMEEADTSYYDDKIATIKQQIADYAPMYSGISRRKTPSLAGFKVGPPLPANYVNPLASTGETEPNDPMQAKNTGGKQLTDQKYREFLHQAGGDEKEAQRLARQDGYVW